MLKIEDRDSVGRPPSAMSLSSSRSSTTKVAKNRYRSHVWHYFERDGDYAKCNVCQHNIKFNKYRSTSVFISHLEHVHLITKYTRLKDFKDFHLIPTKLAQCKNPQLCMRVRVSENFEEYGNGFWRCKNCTYTIRLKKYIAMFHHLKTEHWRPTRKSSADCTVNSEEHELDAENVSGDMNGCTEKMETDVLVEPSTTSAAENLGKNDKPTSGDGDDLGNGLVEPSTSRATENLEKNGEPTTGDMEAEARPVSPIIKTRRLVNLQTAVDRKNEQSNIDLIKDCQILYDDNRRKFDHRYSKTAERNPVTSLRQTRIRKTPTSRTRPKPRSKPRSKPRATPKTEITIEQIKLRASDLHNLDIQVPLANLSPKVDVYRYRNGHTSVSYELIKTEKGGGRHNVAVITLNRPKALNALCKKLVDELNDAVTKFDKDDNVDVIVITGNETAFAAGTDVKEMQNYTYSQSFKDNFPINWDGISNARKPVIAAVNGFAFGGGFELALACDIVYAGENARFGLPEIVMGTIPGAGGTQRLTRVVGKSKAMEMILTGNHILAEEAEKCGLVSKIFPPDQLLSEAIKLGEKMSRHSQLIVSMAKELVNAAFETTLKTGLQIEKNILNGTLATTDRQEGITAFIEKRVPNFRNE